MGRKQHIEIAKGNAHTAFRYLAANQASVTSAEGNDHTAQGEGTLLLQEDLKRVRYLSAAGNPGTWATLYPGYTVTGSAPTADDDVDAGYEAGHIWIDTSGTAVYICLDNSNGAADWNQIDAAGGGGTTHAASSDNRIARYDGTDQIQGSGITIDDSDNVTGVVGLTMTGDISMTAGTIDSSTSLTLQTDSTDAITIDSSQDATFAGVVHTGDGSSSSVAVGGSSTANTGIVWRSGLADWHIGGILKGTWSSAGLKINVSGSSGSPSLFFVGANEGLFRNAGEVGIAANGAQAALFSDTKLTLPGEIEIDGDLNHDGSNVGFYGTAPVSQQDVSGSTGGNAALQNLLTALAATGLITDSTT